MAIKSYLQWQADTNYTNGAIADADTLLKPVRAVKQDMAELNSYLKALLNGDAGAWISGFNYPIDIIVRYNNRYYQSLQNSNYGRDPAVQPTWWKQLTYADLPSGDSMNIDPSQLDATVTTYGLVFFDETVQKYKYVTSVSNSKIVGWLDFTNNRIYTSGAITIPSGNYYLGDYAVYETGTNGLICASTYAQASTRKLGYILDTNTIFLDFSNHALDYLKTSDIGVSVAGVSNVSSILTPTNGLAALNGKAIQLAADTNLETWANTFPPSGLYNINLTLGQGNLPAGWWYIELIRYSGDVIGVERHVMRATALTGVLNTTYMNTIGDVTGWTGWVNKDGTPVATIISLATGTVPTGFLECNGSTISRTSYATLFALIGTTYGVGDGSTTFTIPDLRGEFIRGFDNGRGIDSGRSFGSFQTDMFRSHAHNKILAPVTVGGGQGTPQGAQTGETVRPTTDAPAGGSETRPRNIALKYCIKY